LNFLEPFDILLEKRFSGIAEPKYTLLYGKSQLGYAKARSADILGHVFEYFPGEFALAEGKKGGLFYTPRSVVELLVEMLGQTTGVDIDAEMLEIIEE
jgi:type I restriction-modification system DNA methylase subunit